MRPDPAAPAIDTRSSAELRAPAARVSLLVMGVAALAYCAFILSLPLFPTQDGPMHLYYARIMQALLFGRDPGLFPHFYTIKHVLPPYALYYYLLLSLGHFVSLVMADKLVICLYVVLFLFGMRFLARSLGPSGDAFSLLAIPLDLNWPLGMGFVNFCLSLALALWALGLWCRVAQSPADARNPRRLVAFVALAVLMMLTHPVPLVFVLGFCFVELAIRLVRRIPPGSPAFRRDALAAFLAALTLGYVKLFTVAHLTQQVDSSHATYRAAVRAVVIGIEILGTVDVFSPRGMLGMLRRGSMFLAAFAALAFAVAQLRRDRKLRRWTLADTWLALAVLLWIAVPILPPDLNASHLFSSRLMIFPLLAVLAGASGAQMPGFDLGRRRLLISATASLLLLAVALGLAQMRLTPIARQIAQIETMPVQSGHQVALALWPDGYDVLKTRITYDPYYWSTARLMRRTGSILYNTPWLDLAIIPVGPQPVMPTSRIPSQSLEIGYYMRLTLADSPASRPILFAPVDEVVINDGAVIQSDPHDPLLALDPVHAQGWTCRPHAFLEICALAGSQPGTAPGAPSSAVYP